MLLSSRVSRKCLTNASTLVRFTSTSPPTSSVAADKISTEPAPEIPACSFQPQVFTGIDYESALAKRKEFVSPGIFSYYRKPLYIHQGHKQWLFDTDGKRYLDFFAGICTVGVGHCHPHIQQAAIDQMSTLGHTTNIYMHPRLQEYAEKLTATLPEHLNVCTFVNSGTEANELAMMLARLHTGNWDILCHRNSYHGAGPYTIGLLSHQTWKYQLPTSFGTHATMNPDPYKGIHQQMCRDSPTTEFDKDCSCEEDGHCPASDFYIGQLQEMFDYNLPKNIAGFFAEPIQGVGGIVQYPRKYLAKAYEKVREHGGICVADEVQTGFGRLGSHFWGFEYAGVSPDIVTMAKSIANGFPMAAVVTTKEIAAKHAGALTVNTFGGGPVACAIASATLDVIEEEQLQQNCAVVGTHFLERMAEVAQGSSLIGDVRGKGLMIGIEMVEDKASKKPLPANLMMDIWERTKEMGLLLGKGGRFGNVFRVQPPMCITKEDADFAVDVIKEALRPFDSANEGC